MPRLASQKKQIRDHLWAGFAITPVDAEHLCCSRRLGARIHNLRKDLKAEGGEYDIETKMISVGTRDGSTARIAQYKLVRTAPTTEGLPS